MYDKIGQASSLAVTNSLYHLSQRKLNYRQVYTGAVQVTIKSTIIKH